MRTLEAIDRELAAACEERNKWIERVNALCAERCDRYNQLKTNEEIVDEHIRVVPMSPRISAVAARQARGQDDFRDSTDAVDQCPTSARMERGDFKSSVEPAL